MKCGGKLVLGGSIESHIWVTSHDNNTSCKNIHIKNKHELLYKELKYEWHFMGEKNVM